MEPPIHPRWLRSHSPVDLVRRTDLDIVNKNVKAVAFPAGSDPGPVSSQVVHVFRKF